MRVKVVNEDSSAAGLLQPGDVIRSFAGTPIDGAQTLLEVVASAAAGQTVLVVIVREGTEQEIEITLRVKS